MSGTSKRKTMAAAFRSRIASAKALDRPYSYDDVAAALETLAALCGWVDRIESVVERANFRRNPSAASLLDATGACVGGSLIAQEIIADIAMIGREIRSQRTKEGLARARIYGTKSGRHIGRPRRLDDVLIARIRALGAGGQSSRQIAVALNIPRRTIRRALEGAVNAQ
jgi:hypothetical protein